MTSQNHQQASLNRRTFVAATAGAAVASCVAAAAGSAVADEVAEASAPEWLGEEPQIADADCVETLDFDVVVVGAGHAGYFAACSAAESGAKTLLMEKLPVGFGIRGDLAAVGSSMQAEQGVEVDPVEICNDLVSQSGNYASYALWRKWADNSGEMIDWYRDFVAKNCPEELFYYEYKMPDQPTRGKNWPISHGTSSRARLVNGVEEATCARMDEYIAGFEGCEVRYCLEMVKLIVEDSAVTGVYAEGDDGMVRVNASKGVIVATGGYAADRTMVEALQPHCDGYSGLECDPAARGAGIRACVWAGAKFEDEHTALIFDRGVIPPSEEVTGGWNGTGYYWHFSSQPWLKVNEYGERFINESGNYDYVFHAAQHYPHRCWYPVWDSNWKTDVERFQTTGCSCIFDEPGTNGDGGTGVEAEEEEILAMIEAGTVVKSDTLKGLAEGLGIDPETFVATCERYNELFDAQCDEDFGKEPFRLSQMANPPFYGAKMGGLILCTLDGILVDTNAQALDADGNAIKGLYVVGNDMGGFFFGTYPNLAVGCAAGRSATFARLAGKHVASL